MKKPKKDRVHMVRIPQGFRFASRYDADLCEGIGLGSEVSAEIVKPRSGRQHRLFMALLRVVFENQEFYETFDAMRFAVMVRLGRVEKVVMHNGEVHIQPGSVAYDAMDGAEFSAVMNDTVALVCSEIIPALDTAGKHEIVRRTYEMLNIPPPTRVSDWWGQGSG